MRKTGQCFINSNDFYSRRSTQRHLLVLHDSVYPCSLFFFYLHSSPSLPSRFSSLPPFFYLFVYCMILLTPTFICLCVKKRQALFFPSPPVVFACDSFLSPPCVLCLLSHQWNIEESTEHVSSSHVCRWVVLQGRFTLPSAIWGRVRSCVCAYVCVCLWVLRLPVCAVPLIQPGMILVKNYNPCQISSKRPSFQFQGFILVFFFSLKKKYL